ncbi:Detected protein of confused Function [Hibiscus syriacus]|uniref:Detected protein of confused Function n=1 Tax=Hibiscus syriacus TaxID=106335 RepID=A0A6A3CWJ7_HIBSY|nr:Detected protein of confused Function [Hibiscus syriacus]
MWSPKVFEQVTKNAVQGLCARRSKLNFVGAHVNVFTGEWTQKDAGIGTSIDSYEYLLMVNMDSAAIVWPLFNNLQAFWPGLQVLAGDIDPAIRTHTAFFSVWKRYGFTPEGFNLAALSVQLAVGPDNLVESGLYKYLYGTEGHLLPATPQISLLQEHCSYFVAYCNRGCLKEESRASDKSVDSQETNGSRASEGWVRSAFPLDSSSFEASSLSGLIRVLNSAPAMATIASVMTAIEGLCPGLTLAQKYGISYLALVDKLNEDSSAKQQDTVVQSHAIVFVSDQIANQSLSGDSYNVKESTGKEPESDPSQS